MFENAWDNVTAESRLSCFIFEPGFYSAISSELYESLVRSRTPKHSDLATDFCRGRRGHGLANSLDGPAVGVKIGGVSVHRLA